MLAEARRDYPVISWVHQEIATWQPERQPELIFSNAALQWLPSHEKLFPALVQLLRPGGVLAVQMPRHFESPSHLELRELVCGREWRAQLEPLLLTPVPAPETYWNLLSPLASTVELWETIYVQVLDGPNPVVDFMRGTALRPFLSVLSKEGGARFVAEFTERMAAAYPPQPNGQTLFPFRRLFLIAQY
jgi:trans-aconitate 2-methyltransferase